MTISIEKTLRIDQAEKWESQGIETIDSSKRFTQELNLYSVKDVFNTNRIWIRQDNQKYIFVIDDTPRFAIDKTVMQQRLEDFYQQQTQEELAIRLLDTEWQYITGTSKQELNDLKSDIETDMNIEDAKYRVERYIKFFEQELTLAKESTALFEGHKYNRADKGLWNLQKVEIKRRLEQLKKIQDQIQRLEKNKGKKYTITKDNEIKEVKMDDINAYDTDLTILQFNQRIEEIMKEAPEFIKTRNEIILENGDTTPYYDIIVNNVHDATQIKIIFEQINADYALLDKMALTDTKRQVLQKDLKRLQEYLEKYANNPNAPLEAFVPKSGAAFEEFYKLNPALENLIQLNARSGRKSEKEPNPAYPGTAAYRKQQEEENKETTDKQATKDKKWNAYIPSEYDNAKEAFAKWGINGEVKYRIDQTNMKPEQKQFRSGVGNLAVTGGMIIVGWKMLKSAWNLITEKNKWDKEKKRKDRAWLLAPTALIFGSQAWTGQWPIGLFKWGAASEKIAGIFGRNEGNEKNGESKQDQETRIKYESFPWATALFNGMTYGEMAQFLIQDGDQIKIDPNRYDELLTTLEKDKKNPGGAEFVRSIGKNDDKRILDLALTGMGITSVAQLQNNPDMKFNETASEAIIRLRTVGGYMEDKWYNRLNSETQYLVDQYISTGKPTLEDLDKRGDIFYKELEIQDKSWLKNKIVEIAKGDKKKEEELLLAMNSFYDYFPVSNETIDIQGTRPNITFITYGETTPLNLDKKTIADLSVNRKFSSYLETFKAANLTNYIKKLCKGKEAKSEKPFYLSSGKDITFDNAKIFSKDFDTEMVNAWWGGTLENISPTLEDNKQAYCDYLNNITPKFWKEQTTK